MTRKDPLHTHRNYGIPRPTYRRMATLTLRAEIINLVLIIIALAGLVAVNLAILWVLS